MARGRPFVVREALERSQCSVGIVVTSIGLNANLNLELALRTWYSVGSGYWEEFLSATLCMLWLCFLFFSFSPIRSCKSLSCAGLKDWMVQNFLPDSRV